MGYKGKYTANIKCPFYISEGQTYMNCEGFFQDTVIRHKFNNEVQKDYFQEEYCCTFSSDCPLKMKKEIDYGE